MITIEFFLIKLRIYYGLFHICKVKGYAREVGNEQGAFAERIVVIKREPHYFDFFIALKIINLRLMRRMKIKFYCQIICIQSFQEPFIIKQFLIKLIILRFFKSWIIFPGSCISISIGS